MSEIDSLEIADEPVTNNLEQDQSDAPHEPSTPPTISLHDYITPPQNVPFAPSSLTDNVKNKLSQVAPDNYRCLITRFNQTLQCSHVLQRATSRSDVSVLGL
jgi:hypothetical protein